MRTMSASAWDDATEPYSRLPVVISPQRIRVGFLRLLTLCYTTLGSHPWRIARLWRMARCFE